jgi:peptidylprolyl isomerase
MDEALIGTKVGGKRQLIIPPSLGYGPYPYGDIPGNSVLVFTVEVVSAQ